MSKQETVTHKKNKLKEYVNLFIKSVMDKKYNVDDELEVVFGKSRPLSKMDFDNVVSKLKSSGFRCHNSGDYHLNINNQFSNKGYVKMSNIRATISGLGNIQEYCKSNTLNVDDLKSKNVRFMQKRQKQIRVEGDDKGAYLQPIKYDDLNFKINYKNELTLSNRHGLVLGTIEDWNKRKKTFRLLKRFTFVKDDVDCPIKIDMSIVRTSTTSLSKCRISSCSELATKKCPTCKTIGYCSSEHMRGGRNSHKNECKLIVNGDLVKRDVMVPEFMIEKSNVFNNQEIYEIEIEVDNARLERMISSRRDGRLGETDAIFRKKTISELGGHVIQTLNTGIKSVLSGLQESNYPRSNTVMNNVLMNYLNVINSNTKKNDLDRQVVSRDFIGPSSISLEIKNIVKLDSDLGVGNIRKPYAVTEKADGLRKLLFINESGKIYLINTNMRVQFTGVITNNPKCYNTVIDGEHVITGKKNDFINLYLAFDIYFINGKDVRSNGFISKKSQDGRLVALNNLLIILNAESITGGKIDMSIKIKEFEYSDEKDKENIFYKCRSILDRMERGEYEYNTDGLVFTPAHMGVGSDKIGEKLRPIKQTWIHSFKWKPPEYNTIDFLVTTAKNDNGDDIVKNLFESGNEIREYKTLQLRVGYDEKRHGYLNPVDDVLQDNLPVFSNLNNREYGEYKPVLFYPSEPTLSYPGYLSNILLEQIGSDRFMMIENKEEVIEDETIVEFKFIKTNDELWQWVPIRVRYDKTAEYRSGGRNYGNSFTTAQSVWSSIHNPVNIDMIRGEGIPDQVEDEVYYNLNHHKTETRGLRDFHNLYVKKNLISNIAKKDGLLIDMSVGKGGDLQKWINSNLSFIFGLDLSKDNIENKLDGAYARYLNCCKRYKKLPKVVFIHGDSGLNIRSGEAGKDDKAKLISRAIFGNGPKDEGKLGTNVFNKYGIASDGFDIVSNQFSLHYFFENNQVLNGFLRNVSECCRVGGYFIGCCYDGEKIFDLLKDIGQEETKRIVSFKNRDNIMLSIKKKYNDGTFKNDHTCVGKRIDVMQESINKVFPEYLVNFKYLSRLLSNYGFSELTKEETESVNLPNSIGSFKELYNKMKQDHRGGSINDRSVGSAFKMSIQEKEISFLNNYFIFKKRTDVDTDLVSKNMQTGNSSNFESNMESKMDSDVNTGSPEKLIKLRPTIKKLGKIIIATDESGISDDGKEYKEPLIEEIHPVPDSPIST